MGEPPYRVTGYDKAGKPVQRDFTDRAKAVKFANSLATSELRLGRLHGKPIAGSGGTTKDGLLGRLWDRMWGQ